MREKTFVTVVKQVPENFHKREHARIERLSDAAKVCQEMFLKN